MNGLPISDMAAKRLKGPLLATLVTAVCVALGYLAREVLPHANIALIFLTGVLVVAARAGLGPALLAGVLGFLAFNYFFITPYYTLAVQDDGDVATLVFFLIMATITGNLAGRMHAEVDRNRTMVDRLTNINAFTRQLAAAPHAEAVRQDLVNHLGSNLHAPCWIVGGDGPDGRQYSASASTGGKPPNENLLAWQGSGEAEIGSYWLYRPQEDAQLGSVIVDAEGLDDSQRELLRTLYGLARVALERANLVSDLEEAHALTQQEQLRSALLSSVSHDLRTPLASIIGSSSSLLEYGPDIEIGNHLELLQTILDEAERLNRYIQNLLDMTRLGSGRIMPRRDWEETSDIISTALERIHIDRQSQTVEVDIDPTLPLLHVQAALIEQVLVNILDNALRYSPPGGRISIEAYRADGNAVIDVTDQGPGVAEQDREKIFDMFFTVKDRDARVGSGLGLAICKGVINAHGGEIRALANPQGQGTCIRIILPIEGGESA